MFNLKDHSARTDPERIRNVGVIAHVDHGKTTLCDHLLADAGLMARSLAGEARTLDFLPEEQKRGITIESSIITFPIAHEKKEYIINLIDTPGHVDFSGKVAEALYVVDGALVVVDAVEGVMAQTEVVLKQAIKEKIIPVLVINKIDRLFSELMLPEKKIQERLQSILDRINSILYEGFKGKYQIDFSRGNLVIGSAIHGWGISYDDIKKKPTVMKEIKDAYKKQEHQKIKSEFPIAERIFNMIIKKIPSPKQRQKYLVEIRKIKTEEDTYVKKCSLDNPLISVAGKIHEINHFQFVSIIRILTGKLKVGMKIKNQRTGKISRVDNLYLIQGHKTISVKIAYPGEVIGVSLKNLALPGDTLTDPGLKYSFYYGIDYIQDPIFSISIEPKNLKHLNRLVKYLEDISLAVPNLDLEINQETGEIQLHGVGTLQLELVLKRLEEEGISIYSTPPQITYYEIPQKKVKVNYHSPVGMSFIGIVSPFNRGKEELSSGKFKIIYKSKRDNILAISKEIKLKEDQIVAIIDGFKIATQFGPIRKYRVRDTIILVENIEIEKQPTYEDFLISSKGFVHYALKNSDVTIFEPVFEFKVSTPTRWLGNVLIVLERNSAKIKHVDSFSNNSTIVGTIPVSFAKSLGSEIRDASEGRATITLRMLGYKPINS